MSGRDFRPVWAGGEDKVISFCADDFGMNAAINDGILELAELGRLTATSCMSRSPAFHAGAEALARVPLQTGLHLNLSEASESGAFHLPLSRLIVACYRRQVDREVVSDEIRRQLDRFEDALGRPPCYVDGHQHVHQLPVVRDCLLGILNERYAGRLPWLRSTRARAAWKIPCGFKAWVIETLGAVALRRQASRMGFAMNPGFLGVYGFDQPLERYLAYMDTWVAAATSGDLIMCHPAKAVDTSDQLAAQRVVEFTALKSPEFAAILARHRAGVASGR